MIEWGLEVESLIAARLLERYASAAYLLDQGPTERGPERATRTA